MSSPLNRQTVQCFPTQDAWQRGAGLSVMTDFLNNEISILSMDPVRYTRRVHPLPPRVDHEGLEKCAFRTRRTVEFRPIRDTDAQSRMTREATSYCK